MGPFRHSVLRSPDCGAILRVDLVSADDRLIASFKRVDDATQVVRLLNLGWAIQEAERVGNINLPVLDMPIICEGWVILRREDWNAVQDAGLQMKKNHAKTR